MAPQPLLLLAGPTGAGKTAASLALCSEFAGAVVNFDSRQVFRDFPIITAQPDAGEQAQCPHLLYGFLDCTEKITAGAFTRLARQAIDEVRAMGRLPVLVGGTGLYMRSLLKGLAPIPRIPGDVGRALAARVDAEGLAALYEELQGADPEYAAAIHANDRQRILRALEVLEHTGKPLSWWHRQPVEEPPYASLVLGLRVELADLLPRLEQRIEAMLAAGALDEARRAMGRCPDPAAPGWSGIGCAELLRHLRGELSLDEAKELWLRNTRAYAKRQLTWFAKEEAVQWFDPADIPGMIRAARDFLAAQGLM